jgi:hypothetical protein
MNMLNIQCMKSLNNNLTKLYLALRILCFQSAFLGLEKSALKPKVGIGILWRHPNNLMRRPNILRVTILKTASYPVTSKRLIEWESFYFSNPGPSYRCEHLIRRNLLFLQVVRIFANMLANETFWVSTVQKSSIRRGFLSSYFIRTSTDKPVNRVSCTWFFGTFFNSNLKYKVSKLLNHKYKITCFGAPNSQSNT